MSDAYKKAKAGRLTFKGGELAAVKSIEKKKKKKKKAKQDDSINGDGDETVSALAETAEGEAGDAEDRSIYTIDAAKRMNYEELFPVETKKFGYDPANKDRSGARSVEEALDNRVKKKADRYCKWTLVSWQSLFDALFLDSSCFHSLGSSDFSR